MSTVFGGLFFVILVLAGFNLMLWNFIQFDAYNHIVASMGTKDALARAENLVVTAPGASGFAGTSFNITLSNQGGVTTTISRIYVQNLSPTNSLQCQGAALCILDPAPASPGFSNANIQVGERNHVVYVYGLTIKDGSGYKVVLSTTRGNQFSFFYPWPANLFGGTNSNQTNTAHGDLDVKFDINSFNFTRGTQTVSQPGYTVPYATNVIFWVKVVNNAIFPISLSQYTSLYFVCYQDRFGSGSGTCNETDLNYVVDNQTLNPSNIIAYDQVNRPYVIPPATANGPSTPVIVHFGSFYPAGTQPQDVDFPTPYLVFMGFFYTVNGQIVGQTISFVAIRACATYPSCP
jgi:hypothetical protein